MKYLHMLAFILLIIGGLNWGLVAFNVNVVDIVFGGVPGLVNLIYILVGLSALYELGTHKKNCKKCSSQSS